jgi:uncharacterized protein (TIGR02147 family)
MTVNKSEKSSIFGGLESRAWIRTHLKSLPNQGRGQLTRLAAHLRVNTTLVSQVMSGSRHFSDEQALEVAEFFGLIGVEQEYFVLLIQQEKAGSAKLRTYIADKLKDLKATALELKNRVQMERSLTDEERTRFYSSWLYSAVRLYCSLGEGKTLEEVCNKFGLERIRAQEIVQFLVGTGLCVQAKGLYKLGTQSTFIEQSSPHYLKHLTNWRLKAVEAADQSKPENFLVTAPMSLSEADFEHVREKLLKTLKETLATVKDSREETLACLNIDFFRV